MGERKAALDAKIAGEVLSILSSLFVLTVVCGPSAEAKKRRKEYAWRLTAYIATIDLLMYSVGFIFDMAFLTNVWQPEDKSIPCNFGGFVVQFSLFTENIFICILAIVVHRLAASEGRPVKVKEQWWHSASVVFLGIATASLVFAFGSGYHPATPWREQFPYCWIDRSFAQQLLLYFWVYAEVLFTFFILIYP